MVELRHGPCHCLQTIHIVYGVFDLVWQKVPNPWVSDRTPPDPKGVGFTRHVKQ